MKQMEGRAEVERETGGTKGEAERRRGRVGEREEEEEMESRARRQKTTRGREKQEKHQKLDVMREEGVLKLASCAPPTLNMSGKPPELLTHSHIHSASCTFSFFFFFYPAQNCTLVQRYELFLVG